MIRFAQALSALLPLLTLATLDIAPPAAAAPPMVARAIRVHDGDTFTAALDSRTCQVRLWGIDAPELAQTYGTSATLTLRSLLDRTTFTLTIRSIDRYGRRVADITLPGGLNVNQEMVRRGAAWWYRDYARKAAGIMAAEYQARRDHAGLWALPMPQAPWDFRQTRARPISPRR